MAAALMARLPGRYGRRTRAKRAARTRYRGKFAAKSHLSRPGDCKYRFLDFCNGRLAGAALGDATAPPATLRRIAHKSTRREKRRADAPS